MKVLEILKNFFKMNRKNKDQKLITDGNDVVKTNDFKKSLYVGDIDVKKQPSIEECIAEFIKQYDIQEKNNPDSSKKAYHAYLRMFCEEEDLGDNLANQKKIR